jgi:hypothetical protein
VRPLLRKELRALLPVFLLLLAMFSAELLYEPFISRLDERSWAHRAGVEPGDSAGKGLAIFLCGLLVAYSLFPREHDERTVEFLYSLPVGRARIFAAKVLAGLLVLSAGFVCGDVTVWALQLPNQQSFSGHQFRLDVALTGTALFVSSGAVVLCHGIALSFFRRFGLVLYGLAAWVVILLQRLDPGAAFLDPTQLVAMEYEGTRLLVPWDALLFHGAGALLALAVAYVLWMGPAERLALAFAHGFDRLPGRIALGCGTFALVGLGLSLLVYLGANDDEERAPVRYASFATARAETERFDFTYPVDARARALWLIGRADEAHAQVRAALGAEGPQAPRIVVDLTERSSEHAGITAWQKIRMDLAGEEDEGELLHTFLHEATHALSLQESRRRLHDHQRAVKAFSEGLAEHVAFRITGDARALAASRQHAIAACLRQDLPFHVLVDDEALRARHDPHLVYPVGETWVEALVRVHGPTAPGAVLRAMARDGAPRGLAPLPFWQDTMQAAGFDLERVTGAWHELLAELEVEHAGFMDELPRLSGGVAGRAGDEVLIVARLDRDAPVGATFTVTVREDADTPDSELQRAWGQPDEREPRRVELRLDGSSLRGRRFELQLGVQLVGHHLPIQEPWQSAVMPR